MPRSPGTPSAAATSSTYTHLPGVPRTLRDETLQSEAAAIRDKYLEQRVVRLAAHQADYDKALRQASPFTTKEGWCAACAPGVLQCCAMPWRWRDAMPLACAPSAWSAPMCVIGAPLCACPCQQLLCGVPVSAAGDALWTCGGVHNLCTRRFIVALGKLCDGGREGEVVEAIKRKLMEKDQYRQTVRRETFCDDCL